MQITVNGYNAKKRLDYFLAENFTGFSRSYIQKQIRQKNVSVVREGKELELSCSLLLKENDCLSLDLKPSEKADVKGKDIPLNTIYEDSDILVISKQANLTCHPSSTESENTLVNALLYKDEKKFSQLIDPEDQFPRPGIVHRLDKDTSGVMVIAKNKDSYETMKKTFADRNVDKIYLALVWGTPNISQGLIDNLIHRNPYNYEQMKTSTKYGKRAISHYKTIASKNNVSLLKFKIETGRTHQIRSHCKFSLKTPIIADKLYGDKKKDKQNNISRQMLHSWRMKFPHPTKGELSIFTAPLEKDFAQALNSFDIYVE